MATDFPVLVMLVLEFVKTNQIENALEEFDDCLETVYKGEAGDRRQVAFERLAAALPITADEKKLLSALDLADSALNCELIRMAFTCGVLWGKTHVRAKIEVNFGVDMSKDE